MPIRSLSNRTLLSFLAVWPMALAPLSAGNVLCRARAQTQQEPEPGGERDDRGPWAFYAALGIAAALLGAHLAQVFTVEAPPVHLDPLGNSGLAPIGPDLSSGLGATEPGTTALLSAQAEAGPPLNWAGFGKSDAEAARDPAMGLLSPEEAGARLFIHFNAPCYEEQMRVHAVVFRAWRQWADFMAARHPLKALDRPDLEAWGLIATLYGEAAQVLETSGRPQLDPDQVKAIETRLIDLHNRFYLKHLFGDIRFPKKAFPPMREAVVQMEETLADLAIGGVRVFRSCTAPVPAYPLFPDEDPRGERAEPRRREPVRE